MYGSEASPLNRRWALLALFVFSCAYPATLCADRDLMKLRPEDWRPGPETSSPQRYGDAMQFACPFPDSIDRHVWDVSTDAKLLDDFHGLEFIYAMDRPEVFRGLSWYVQSGSGWFVTPLPVGDGLRRVWVPFGSFERDGVTEGWREVQAFRLSPWSAGLGEGTLTLHTVRARNARIGILRPGVPSLPDAGERAFGQRSADVWARDLYEIGLPPAMINEENFTDADLAGLQTLVLPYNPNPPVPVVRAIKDFVKKGGKLMVCYNAHEEYAALVGVAPQRWTSATLPGQFYKLSFTGAANWAGPAAVLQPDTPHLLPATPRAKDARLLAEWTDAGDRATRPAIVVSPRGAWFSYLLGSDDDAARRRMLAFLIDQFMPGTALDAARARRQFLQQEVAHAGKSINIENVHLALKKRDAAAAWDALDQAAEQLRTAKTAGFILPENTPTGIWDHSGNGLHGGDWSRTLRELGEAGFTDLFVYTKRNGPVPLAAATAARDSAVRIHAWHLCYNLEGMPAETLRALEIAGRLQRSAPGETVNWLCPTRADNRRDEVERLLQLAATPGIAGIHLDYIRYPDENTCYCSNCRDGFAATQSGKTGRWPDAVREGGEAHKAFLDWRADQVSLLVREVAEAVREQFPARQISAAVWPDVRTVKARIGQDWPRWLAEGWVDFITPMSYTDSTGVFSAWTADHAALPGAKGKIWAGIGVTSAHSRLPAASVLRQIEAGLGAGAAGVVIFDLNATVRAELFPVLKTMRAR